MSGLRWVRASNPGPFTLDGTRTYVVGLDRVAVVDPGPDLEEHVRAVVALVRSASHVSLVLTHGHADHAGAVDRLVPTLGRTMSEPVPVLGAGHVRARPPDPRRGIDTDAGPLLAVPSPGHTRDHLCFHWPAARALFAGDHLMGRGDTTWVAEYSGCVADYLTSLARLRRLPLDVIHPAHGPSLHDPAEAFERFAAHRRARIEAVEAVLTRRPDADDEELFVEIYGDSVPPGLGEAARRSLRALREYVDTRGGGGLSSPLRP